jgi:hypothetical protein
MSRLHGLPIIALVTAGIFSTGMLAIDAGSAWGSLKSKTLNGDYGMTLSQTCVLTPIQSPPSSGFDPGTGQLLTEGEIVSAVSSGVIRFAENGTATIEEGRLSEVFHNNTQPGDLPVVAGNEYTCEGSYVLDVAGRLSMDLTCNVKSSNPGITITLKPFKLEGFASRARQNVELSAIAGNIQILEISAGGTVVQQRERICLQSLSASKLRNGGHD